MAAFRATLEEIIESNVLLHVVDITHPNAAEQVSAVEETLEELGASDKPIIMAFNKVDELTLHKNGPLNRPRTTCSWGSGCVIIRTRC